MNIEECYGLMGADYNSAISRFMKDALLLKYGKKFAQSSDYDCLKKAISEKDMENAFLFSHNLKGMSLNLSYTGLYEASSGLCEAIRHSEPEDRILVLFDALSEQYGIVLNYIDLMDA